MNTTTLEPLQGRAQFADQEKTLLRQLFAANLPPIARIRQQLELAQPETISDLILENTGLEFMVDYYFRLLPPRLGARIVSDPRFTVRAAICLFFCQQLRRTANAERADHRMEGYWRLVTHEKLTLVLRELLRMGEAREGVFSILQYMNRDSLVHLLDDPDVDAGELLELFRELNDGVHQLFSANLDLFDFVCRLASEAGDNDYLEYLSAGGFAGLLMEMRIAETLIEEAIGRLAQPDATDTTEPNGQTLPLRVLVHLLDDIPRPVRRLVLERLEQLGHIPSGLAVSFLQEQL